MCCAGRSTPRGIDPLGVPRKKRLFWPTWKPTQRSLNKARKEILPLRLLNAAAICQKKIVIRNAPKPLRASAQHQATLMRILPKNPKPMRDIPLFKRNFSGSTLPKPRLKNAAESSMMKTPDYMKGRKNSVRKPPGGAKKQERRAVNMSLLRWYAYFPPYGFGLFYSHRIYSHRIKRSPIRKGRVSLDKAAQQKREDDPSSRFQHIDLLISSYISRVPRWKGPSPCRSRCGQSFRGA